MESDKPDLNSILESARAQLEMYRRASQEELNEPTKEIILTRSKDKEMEDVSGPLFERNKESSVGVECSRAASGKSVSSRKSCEPSKDTKDSRGNSEMETGGVDVEGEESSNKNFDSSTMTLGDQGSFQNQAELTSQTTYTNIHDLTGPVKDDILVVTSAVTEPIDKIDAPSQVSQNIQETSSDTATLNITTSSDITAANDDMGKQDDSNHNQMAFIRGWKSDPCRDSRQETIVTETFPREKIWEEVVDKGDAVKAAGAGTREGSPVRTDAKLIQEVAQRLSQLEVEGNQCSWLEPNIADQGSNLLRDSEISKDSTYSNSEDSSVKTESKDEIEYRGFSIFDNPSLPQNFIDNTLDNRQVDFVEHFNENGIGKFDANIAKVSDKSMFEDEGFVDSKDLMDSTKIIFISDQEDEQSCKPFETEDDNSCLLEPSSAGRSLDLQSDLEAKPSLTDVHPLDQGKNHDNIGEADADSNRIISLEGLRSNTNDEQLLDEVVAETQRVNAVNSPTDQRGIMSSEDAGVLMISHPLNDVTNDNSLNIPSDNESPTLASACYNQENTQTIRETPLNCTESIKHSQHLAQENNEPLRVITENLHSPSKPNTPSISSSVETPPKTLLDKIISAKTSSDKTPIAKTSSAKIISGKTSTETALAKPPSNTTHASETPAKTPSTETPSPKTPLNKNSSAKTPSNETASPKTPLNKTSSAKTSPTKTSSTKTTSSRTPPSTPRVVEVHKKTETPAEKSVPKKQPKCIGRAIFEVFFKSMSEGKSPLPPHLTAILQNAYAPEDQPQLACVTTIPVLKESHSGSDYESAYECSDRNINLNDSSVISKDRSSSKSDVEVRSPSPVVTIDQISIKSEEPMTSSPINRPPTPHLYVDSKNSATIVNSITPTNLKIQPSIPITPIGSLQNENLMDDLQVSHVKNSGPQQVNPISPSSSSLEGYLPSLNDLQTSVNKVVPLAPAQEIKPIPLLTELEIHEVPQLTESNTCEVPLATEPCVCEIPQVTETDAYEVPLVSKPDTCEVPLVTKPDTCDAPLVTESDAYEEPLVTKPDTYDVPLVTKPDAYDVPQVTEPDAYEVTLVTELETCETPQVTEPDTCEVPLVTESDACEEPLATEPEACEVSQVTESEIETVPLETERQIKNKIEATELEIQEVHLSSIPNIDQLDSEPLLTSFIRHNSDDKNESMISQPSESNECNSESLVTSISMKDKDTVPGPENVPLIDGNEQDLTITSNHDASESLDDSSSENPINRPSTLILPEKLFKKLFNPIDEDGHHGPLEERNLSTQNDQVISNLTRANTHVDTDGCKFVSKVTDEIEQDSSKANYTGIQTPTEHKQFSTKLEPASDLSVEEERPLTPYVSEIRAPTLDITNYIQEPQIPVIRPPSPFGPDFRVGSPGQIDEPSATPVKTPPRPPPRARQTVQPKKKKLNFLKKLFGVKTKSSN